MSERETDHHISAAIITTVAHNPGDEFIRLGQQYLLRELFTNISFHLVHKHDPRSVFRGFDVAEASNLWHPRFVPFQYKLYAARRERTPDDLLSSSDLVVFAGTPFIWLSNTRLLPSHSGNAEWIQPIWERLFEEMPDTPVLNLAAGTSLQTDAQVKRLLQHSSARRFLTRALGRAQLTTARDQRTRAIAGKLGFDIPALPCTSLWSGAGAGLQPEPAQYIAVNVMRHAVHKYRGTITVASDWRELAKRLVDRLSDQGDVLLICHNQDEYAVAREWFPKTECFFSMRPEELLQMYSRARFGVSNRVHGAAGVATFGRPALVIGGDSRVDLIKDFGLPTADVRNLDATSLDRHINDLIDNQETYANRLVETRKTFEPVYKDLIQNASVTLKA